MSVKLLSIEEVFPFPKGKKLTPFLTKLIVRARMLKAVRLSAIENVKFIQIILIKKVFTNLH